DYCIVRSKKFPSRLLHAAGIESPGLASSPAVADYVVGILGEMGLELIPDPDFRDERPPVRRFKEMSDEEKRLAIASDPAWGRIICRCETITEGEIIDAIRRPLGARDLDGVKRRVRAGMGRCQGGFCSPRVTAILARELGADMYDITKKGPGSEILMRPSK
ncbi:MAG: (2Fe-2S)-binding protein, partial [Clostridia bacterium]|nr:(2Fe-2S)-binding protein [Clostridia bacterium]